MFILWMCWRSGFKSISSYRWYNLVGVHIWHDIWHLAYCIVGNSVMILLHPIEGAVPCCSQYSQIHHNPNQNTSVSEDEILIEQDRNSFSHTYKLHTVHIKYTLPSPGQISPICSYILQASFQWLWLYNVLKNGLGSEKTHLLAEPKKQ